MLPLKYTVRNLWREPGKSLQKLLGAGLIVLLVLGAAAFNHGMKRLLTESGSPNNLLFVSAGSEESVERSQLPMATESIIASSLPGISVRGGVVAVSGEVHYMGLVNAGGKAAQALMRGVTPSAFEVHRVVRITEGRWPRAGEVMVGSLAHKTHGLEPAQMAVGQSLEFDGERFAIVGTFDAAGTVMESEIWFNRSDLMTMTQRETLSSVVVRTEDKAALNRADLFAKQRLDLELSVMRESVYYGKLAAFYQPVRAMAWLTAVLVALGAVMGGLNQLYATFSARIRELATLQTLGYGRWGLLWTLVQESLLLHLLAGCAAAFVALLLIDGHMVQFSMGTFRMELTGSVLASGMGVAAFLGLFGALPPALKCLTRPLPTALRSR